jgi:hypothetical protein
VIGKRVGQALDGNLQRVTASEASSRSSKREWLSEVWGVYKEARVASDELLVSSV